MINYKAFFFLQLFLIYFQVAVGQQTNIPERVISLSVKPGLQFNLPRFKVSPGEKIKIIFINTDDMDHNFVITKPGKREEVVREALNLGESGPAENYIPKSPQILWSIPVLSPDESGSISFTAPKETGAYPYVCTYPGHGFIMFGAMYVTDGVLPDLRTDQNIPPARRTESTTAPKSSEHTGHNMKTVKPLHPYTPVSPYLYRVFIDGASPAAIAVSLPNQLSYCWDAGTCYLRFAWSGGFLDNTELWRGKGDATAKVVGSIFFRDRTSFPLSLQNGKVPVVSYKGYREVDRYPEFHYTVDGLDVYELILPNTAGDGLIRNFRIPGASGPVWLLTSAQDGVDYTSSAGIWENGKLQLTRKQAKNFSITMTINENAKP